MINPPTLRVIRGLRWAGKASSGRGGGRERVRERVVKYFSRNNDDDDYDDDDYNSIQFNSIGVYLCAGLPAQVPIIKPAQRHKQNTNTVQIQKRKT
jgi:hypothetical protein